MKNNLEAIINLLSTGINNIQRTPKETGEGLKAFSKILEDFIKLSDKEKFEYCKQFFSDKNNRDACESFEMRHPESIFNKYIPK